jgi:hypothetical protein
VAAETGTLRNSGQYLVGYVVYTFIPEDFSTKLKSTMLHVSLGQGSEWLNNVNSVCVYVIVARRVFHCLVYVNTDSPFVNLCSERENDVVSFSMSNQRQ